MQKVVFTILFILCFSFLQMKEAHASYTLRGGKLLNTKEVATMSVQEHYSAALEAYQKKNWEEAASQAIIVIKNFPSTPFAQDVLFYLGIAYFHLEDYEMANRYLSEYLKKQAIPKHFEEAIQHKFAIAEQFHKGAKKHLMGWKGMPKWLPAQEDAIAIYDEVITALPHHDLAAQALFLKAKLFLEEGDYKNCIEAFQTLLRRFPKHRLTPDGYVGIGEAYFLQSRSEFPHPDFLELARINLRKFRQSFPSEPKTAEAEKIFLEMQEVYARNLYETGKFFERTKKSSAAYIYYSKVVATYPDTKMAALSQKRLQKLKPSSEKEALQADK